MNPDTQSANTPDEIVAAIVEYILVENASSYTKDTLPRDESLLELGVLDSAGIVELVVFIEDRWDIQIADEHFTKERMGSLTKIASLVQEYVAAKR